MTTNIVGHDAVVHLVSEDVFIDIKFTAFTGGGEGGGFSYERTGYVPLVLRGSALTSVRRFGSFVDPGATASNSAGVPLAVSVSGNLDTTIPGNYSLIYSAIDSLGFVSVTNRLVSVLETNGAPSWWLSRYNLETNEMTALLDGDGVGAMNWCEYLAGTDPTNKESVLKVSVLSDGMSVVWPGVAGRVYSVYQTTNLAVPFGLAPGGSNLTANPQGNTYTNVDGPLPQTRFFKVGVELSDP
jgi:hypothetical protein